MSDEQVEVTVQPTDIYAASRIGVILGVPDINGSRQQDLLSRELARHRIAAETREGTRVDIHAERSAFEAWWRMWCPDRDMPSVASHIFDAWLARARLSLSADGAGR